MNNTRRGKQSTYETKLAIFMGNPVFTRLEAVWGMSRYFSQAEDWTETVNRMMYFCVG